jgi:hypothetical protein
MAVGGDVESLQAQVVQEMELNSDSLNDSVDPDGAIAKRSTICSC